MSIILPLQKIQTLHALEKYRFLHHFLPHPQLRTRANFLSHSALVFYCLILFVFLGFTKLIPRIAPGILGYASDIRINALLADTNKKREAFGLKSLVVNEALTKAAQEKANDMFKKGYWAHVAPDGTEPWDFILGQDYDYLYAGENLAKNFNTSDEVVEAWYNSPSHRENLLNKNYDEIGFAVVNGVLDGYETTLVVQMFGRTKNSLSFASTAPRALSQPTETLKPVTIEKVAANTRSVSAPVLGLKEFTLDLSKVSKYSALSFVLFLVSLLGLDIWYSKRHSILKLNGHTFAHLTFLLVLVFGMWFALTPGKIL